MSVTKSDKTAIREFFETTLRNGTRYSCVLPHLGLMLTYEYVDSEDGKERLERAYNRLFDALEKRRKNNPQR